MATSVTPGPALRYARGSARGPLHHPAGHGLASQRAMDIEGGAFTPQDHLERSDIAESDKRLSIVRYLVEWQLVSDATGTFPSRPIDLREASRSA